MFFSDTRISVGKFKAFIIILAGFVISILFCIAIAAFIDLHISGEGNYIIPCLLCVGLLVVGLLIFSRGMRLNKLLGDCKRYAAALGSGNIVSIEQLAAACGQNSGLVYENLNKMLSSGYLRNIYVDQGRGRIIFLNSKGMEIDPASIIERPEMTSATCTACGGVTVLPLNESGICAYCGSKIKG